MPLPDAWPPAKLLQTLYHAQPVLLVHHRGCLPWPPGEQLPCACVSLEDLTAAANAGRQHGGGNSQVISPAANQARDVAEPQEQRPLPFMCVLFTSGSTGTPVGAWVWRVALEGGGQGRRQVPFCSHGNHICSAAS